MPRRANERGLTETPHENALVYHAIRAGVKRWLRIDRPTTFSILGVRLDRLSVPRGTDSPFVSFDKRGLKPLF